MHQLLPAIPWALLLVAAAFAVCVAGGASYLMQTEKWPGRWWPTSIALAIVFGAASAAAWGHF